jgi:hypothetical protein
MGPTHPETSIQVACGTISLGTRHNRWVNEELPDGSWVQVGPT